MENKEITFVLFPNLKKQEGSNQPDFTGEIVIGEERKRLAAWKRTSANGNKFLSGKSDEMKPQQKATDDLPTADPFE